MQFWPPTKKNGKSDPHVYPLLQNVNFDLVNPTCHDNCVFFELKKTTHIYKIKKKKKKKGETHEFLILHPFLKEKSITTHHSNINPELTNQKSSNNKLTRKIQVRINKIQQQPKPRIKKPKIKLIQAKHYFTNNT